MRFVFVSERQAQEAVVTITKAQQQWEDWGVAGPGVYWRPKLSMAVSSDGEAVYAELEVLLSDSGLQLERE